MMMMPTKLTTAAAAALILAACSEAASDPMQAPETVPVAMVELTTSSEEARRQVEQGVAIMDMHGLPNNRPFDGRANTHFKRAITEDPDFATAYFLVAVTGLSLDEYRANLARALELATGASDQERLHIEIEERLRRDDVQGAERLARELLALDDTDPRSWMALARVQSRAGREVEARETATRAVEVEPAFTHGHLWIANSYLLYLPQDLDKAEVHVNRALELAPNRSAPHDLEGDLHRAHGRLDESAAAYTRALELDPEDAGLLIQRGHVHTFAGRYDQARADYDASAELGRGNNQASPLIYRAMVSAFAGDHEAAVGELQELDGQLERLGLTDVEGTRVQLQGWIASIAAPTGQIEAATQAVDHAEAIWMARADALQDDGFREDRLADVAFWRSWIAVHDGRFGDARREIARYRELAESESDPAWERPLHATLGMVAMKQGDFAAAVAHLEQSDPDNEYLRFNRAVALVELGRTEEAMPIFQAQASNNFNTAELSLVRRQAQARVGG